MDDIRRPRHIERRNYALPGSPPARPEAQQPAPVHLPHHQAPAPQPAPHQAPPAQHHVPQHHAQQHQPQQHASHTPQPAYTPLTPPAYHQPQQHRPAHPHQGYQQTPAQTAVPVHKVRSSRRIPLPLIGIIGILLASVLFAAGYHFKSSSDENTIPAKIIKQVDYSLYFPAPMPSGYSYMKDTATFQIGQVFYKFSKGDKRVTVKEEPLPQPKPDLNLLKNYRQFDTATGKAAIGSTFGQPTAVVVTPSTVITFNTSGGVSPDDLIKAINNLKNIGKNPAAKT